MVHFRIGPEVCLSNRLIRKMLRLAHASSRDVFYDLGAGRGQLCVLAVLEFNVKRAVGIESHRGRAKRAQQYVKRLGLSKRVEIRHANYYHADISEATIAYNGLVEGTEDLEFYEENLSQGCRLATLSLPLVGVMPQAQDYPFYLMRRPFRRARDQLKWMQSVLTKKTSIPEFLDELRNDRDYYYDLPRLRGLLGRRLGV